MTSKLIMIRHGQSVWNALNLFTGWVDVPLSAKGIDEALKAGDAIADLDIDVIFVSTLMRAQMTAMLAMSRHRSAKTAVLLHDEGKQAAWSGIYSEEEKSNIIPMYQAWELNERMYGQLQGLNKAATIEKYGAEQVHIWRRSFDTAPPGGESLKMTSERTLPYFESNIVSMLAEGKNVFLSAHGNSLRSIIMRLDGLSKEEVLGLELITGKPMTYEFNDGEFSKCLDCDRAW